MSPVRILGIGSPSGDDQAGWLVVDVLQAAGLEDVDIDKLDRPGTRLIPLLAGVSRLILIDATRGGGQAGDIRRFDQEDWPAYGQGLSSHGIGVLDALLLARELDALPARIELYGIEIDTPIQNESVSAPVRDAVHQLAQYIAASLALTTPSR
ncbi:MAG: hydrogenase maturation protease [Gammaproteobacteria bacterium]